MTNFTGSWEADLARSRILGPARDRIRVIIQHDDPKLVQTALSTTAGKEESLTFAFTTDGEESVIEAGGSSGKTRAHWEGAELLIETWIAMGGRDYRFRDYWSLSADGGVLTMEHRDDDLAGQVTLLDRVSGGV